MSLDVLITSSSCLRYRNHRRVRYRVQGRLEVCCCHKHKKTRPKSGFY
ncbi:hypothetical protein QWZ13_00755 [Reinekea marina]|nr:hypothetical protein [Reinekea marina]MDN3647433.1 hypothetical protein [Reinekea marina]